MHVHARMKNPVMILPTAMEALQALSASYEKTGLSARTAHLCQLRASQINGCSTCCDGHPRILRKLGESDERILAVATWRDTNYFDAAERAALALTESLTRIADRDGVPDAVWDEAARHHDEKTLAGLVMAIAAINVWNRLNVATRQVGGAWKP